MTFSAAPAPREITTPIILFGFRQPDRLARVCRALRAQRGVAIDERRIHLMMDGAVSPRTGRRYASGQPPQRHLAPPKPTLCWSIATATGAPAQATRCATRWW